MKKEESIMGKLDGKVAIITGAARGMGAEHAREFLKEGAKVVITDVLEAEGRRLSEELGENTLFLRHDVTRPEEWKRVLDEAVEAFGPVGVLVNNAGYTGPLSTLTSLEDDEYLKVITIDQHGTFYGMKTLIPHMIDSGGGAIVNIASTAGLRHVNGTPNAAYTAAKHAVVGLTKAAAAEYASQNIRINVVCPGGVLTPLLKETYTQEQLDQFAASPIGRLSNPEEVSKPVLFLASDDASYMTGGVVVVDGGLLAQ